MSNQQTLTVPTRKPGDSSNAAASTAFVTQAVSSVGGGPGGGARVTIAVDPPTVPAPVAGDLWWDSTTGIPYIYYNDGDSSQWVVFDASSAGGAGSPSSTIPLMDATPGLAGAFLTYARGDHVHPTDTSRAPTNNPAFTGTITLEGVNFAVHLGDYHTLYNGAGLPALNLGTNTNVHLSGEHLFKSGDNFITYLTVGSTGATFSVQPFSSVAIPVDDNSTKLATTQWVQNELGAASGGVPYDVIPAADSGTGSFGGVSQYARGDHVHPLSPAYAPIASPHFTGIPLADTAAAATSSDQLATTAFVMGAIAAGGTFVDAPGDGGNYGRQFVTGAMGWQKTLPLAGGTMTGQITLPTTPGSGAALAVRRDYIDSINTALNTAIALKAPILSPSFTGTPVTQSTPAASDNSLKLATTEYVDRAASAATGIPEPPNDGFAYARRHNGSTYVWEKVPTLNGGDVIGVGGYRLSSFPLNGGAAITTGSFTLNGFDGNYQHYTNNGPHTLVAPADDCAIDIMIAHGAAAAAITFTGFKVGANTGDAMVFPGATSDRYVLSIRRINNTATYLIKALQ